MLQFYNLEVLPEPHCVKSPDARGGDQFTLPFLAYGGWRHFLVPSHSTVLPSSFPFKGSPGGQFRVIALL